MTATFDAEGYGHLIEIERIERLPKSARRGSPLRAYLRRLRWARDEPKRFLGMLGVRQFEWHGGWFIVVGRRRK